MSQTEDDLFNLLDELANAGTFGYTAEQQITLTAFEPWFVMIQSPVVADDLGVLVTNYTVQYATQPILELIEQNKVDEIRQKEFTFDTNIQANVDLQLDANADFDPNTTYFLSVVPKNNEWFPGNVSNEIEFNLNGLLNANGNGPETTPPPATSGPAPGGDGNAIDMCAANISYTQNGQNITVTRTAISDKQADMFIRHTSQRDFSKLATIGLRDEAYTFVASRDGTHFIKMQAIEGGQPIGTECIQTLHLQPFQVNIPVAPKNGPELTLILAILILTSVGYIGYRKRKFRS